MFKMSSHAHCIYLFSCTIKIVLHDIRFMPRLWETAISPAQCLLFPRLTFNVSLDGIGLRAGVLGQDLPTKAINFRATGQRSPPTYSQERLDVFLLCLLGRLALVLLPRVPLVLASHVKHTCLFSRCQYTRDVEQKRRTGPVGVDVTDVGLLEQTVELREGKACRQRMLEG
jgi:hypothetical protein